MGETSRTRKKAERKEGKAVTVNEKKYHEPENHCDFECNGRWLRGFEKSNEI